MGNYDCTATCRVRGVRHYRKKGLGGEKSECVQSVHWTCFDAVAVVYSVRGGLGADLTGERRFPSALASHVEQLSTYESVSWSFSHMSGTVVVRDASVE